MVDGYLFYGKNDVDARGGVGNHVPGLIKSQSGAAGREIRGGNCTVLAESFATNYDGLPADVIAIKACQCGRVDCSRGYHRTGRGMVSFPHDLLAGILTAGANAERRREVDGSVITDVNVRLRSP